MTVRVAAVLVALAATSAYSQEPQPQPTSRNARELLNVVPDLSGRGRGDVQAVPMAEVPRPPEPPEGANSWSLIVHTTGGFTGRGVGTVTISSDGRMVCPAPCASLVETQMKLISSSVASIQEAAWVARAPTGFCRDCVFTTVVLKRREGDGVRTYIASWDDSQSATPELRELRRLALELQSARSGR